MTALYPLGVLIVLIGLVVMLHAELIKPRPRWAGRVLPARIAAQMTTEEREELFDFLRKHDLDKNAIGELTYHEVGQKRWISATEYLTDDEGRRYLDPITRNAASRDRYKALRTPLPPWWVPRG